MLEFEIIHDEESQQVRLELDEVIIGRRNEKQPVQLDLSPDDLVSRVHARVWVEEGAVLIEDLGSSGGTRVNHRKITGPTELQSVTEVKLGETSLTVCCPVPKPAVARPPGKSKRRKRPLRHPTLKISRDAEGAATLDEPESIGESKKPTKLKRKKVRPRAELDPPPQPEPQPGPAAEDAFHAEVIVEGKIQNYVIEQEEVRIGRHHPGADIHLDLSNDLLVSRNHARVWQTRGICWIEDLDSTHGTRVNGAILSGACVIKPEDQVQIGSVILRFWVEAAPASLEPAKKRSVKKRPAPVVEEPPEDDEAFPALDSYPVYKEDSYTYHPPEHRTTEDLEAAFLSRKSPMGRIRATHERSLDQPFEPGNDADVLIEQLPQLPREFNAHSSAAGLGEWLVGMLAERLEGARRASIFIIDMDNGRIKPLAHVPALKPILSDQLAHRALDQRTAFAWQQVSKKESVRRLSMHAGLYVPLISGEDELGILCVEDTAGESEFSEGQLVALTVVGQLAAVYFQNHLWREAG